MGESPWKFESSRPHHFFRSIWPDWGRPKHLPGRDRQGFASNRHDISDATPAKHCFFTGNVVADKFWDDDPAESALARGSSIVTVGSARLPARKSGIAVRSVRARLTCRRYLPRVRSDRRNDGLSFHKTLRFYFRKIPCPKHVKPLPDGRGGAELVGMPFEGPDHNGAMKIIGRVDRRSIGSRTARQNEQHCSKIGVVHTGSRSIAP